MASYLQVENVSKSYGPKVLFSNINMNINEGDKIALVAPNGTGKTSLLRILAGVESSDGDGTVKFLKDISISFLAQDNVYDHSLSIMEVVLPCAKHCPLHEVEEVLYSLKLTDPQMKIGQLSGGEIKRVAIACMFVAKPDFLVMDEPTNHLDLETIEYLEEYFTRQRCTLLMVTHDRYFLDRVCNQIIEMADGNLYTYNGNYSYYLQKREERMINQRKEVDRARNLLRTELDWMRRMPCARGTKAKYRIDAFYDLKEKAQQKRPESSLNINVQVSRLGKKIVNCSHVDYMYDNWTGVKDFTYNFAPGEKVGIVGKNGVGKSTFLNLISGTIAPTGGEIQIGETVRFGYYRQQGIEFNPNDTVIEAVREIAEVVTLGDGKNVPISTFLNYFLFPPSMHYNKIEKLSGGEKRRLYLLTVLMKNPNVLILDEPTNDLDILTLNVLEEYLKEFAGSVIIVSHDRFFLDKIADHLFVFEGDGVIKDFVGSYSDYREYIKDKEKQKRALEREMAKKEAFKNEAAQAMDNTVQPPKKKKLSYKEQRELEQLEKDLEALGREKMELEEKLSGGEFSAEEISKASVRIGEVLEMLDAKELRWLELNDN